LHVGGEQERRSKSRSYDNWGQICLTREVGRFKVKEEKNSKGEGGLSRGREKEILTMTKGIGLVHSTYGRAERRVEKGGCPRGVVKRFWGTKQLACPVLLLGDTRMTWKKKN